MAKYAIGLDGGGTKTEVAMLSAQGETIYMGRLGPLNPVSYPDSPAKIAEELARFIDADCAAICGMLGGGGHRCASGCFVKGSLEHAKEEIISVVGKALGFGEDKC